MNKWSYCNTPSFQHALIGSLLASIVCGLIGTYIVTRRLVFISGGSDACFFRRNRSGIVYRHLSHSVGSRSVCGTCPLLEWSGSANARICGRTQPSPYSGRWAWHWASCSLSFRPGFAPDLSAYLFGNILTITFGATSPCWAGLAVLLATVLYALYLRPIIYVAFDREFARSQGIPVQVFEYVLMMFIALTIVACLRMVGIVLVISLLTVPQMTANLFYAPVPPHHLAFHRHRLPQLPGRADDILFYLNVPSGASIIFFSIIIYAICKTGKSFWLYLQR